MTSGADFAPLALHEFHCTITGLRARFVDPTNPAQAGGANGTWAANGYVVTTLNTWRFYAVSDVPAEVTLAGDTAGGSVMTIQTGGGSNFVNAPGALGNNGLQRPTDFTATPGPTGYTSQWDSYLAIDGLPTVSFTPGLTAALGATFAGMGGLNGSSFTLNNVAWFDPPNGQLNTTFNPTSGDHEALILQLTVPAGVLISIGNAVIGVAGASASAPFSVVTPPIVCPGDATGDDNVGFDDLTRVLIEWGPCPPDPQPCPEDFDGSGAVGFNDFTIVLVNWGPC